MFINGLSEVIAGVLGYPHPTVSVYTRRLREGGKLSKKGFGRGAAHATPLDAARILIALMMDRGPACAPEVVSDFGGLLLYEQVKVERSFSLMDICHLPDGHTFEQAFAAIIAGFADEKFADAYCSIAQPITVKNRIQGFIWPPPCWVDIFDTAYGASIKFGGALYGYSNESIIDLMAANDYIEQKKSMSRNEHIAMKYKRGIHSTRKIDFQTIAKIAAAVNGCEVDLAVILKRKKAGETTR